MAAIDTATIDAAALKHEREQARASFLTFHEWRDVDGLWNRLRRAETPPEIPPDLQRYVDRTVYMSRKFDDDIRTLIQIKTNNPTRFNAFAYGSSAASRELESLWKLGMASTWDQLHNVSRWLDDYIYEGQSAHGLVGIRQTFKKHVTGEKNGRPEASWPIQAEDTVLDGIDVVGHHLNPKVLYYTYSLSAIDCDVKNSDGKRPTYEQDGSLGWVGEDLPEYFYQANANKKIQIHVRDAEDPIAMCPLDGCDHPKRRITVYICKDGGSEKDYEQVETYDSPFKYCSFLLVGGDVRQTERDPHHKFLPSARVLYDLLQKHNTLMQMLLAMLVRELRDESKYINAGGTNPDTISALAGQEDDGQSETYKRPEPGTRDLAVLPGPVGSYGNPSLEGLLRMLDKVEAEYEERRPNRALTGQQAVSEVTGTASVIQQEGAGVLIGGDLKNWDAAIVRFYENADHAIRFTSFFEPDDAQTMYCVPVSNTGNVVGHRSKSEGEEIYIDASKCGKVRFVATTSKETPSEATNRKMTALQGYNAGVLTKRQRMEAWDVFDPEQQEEELFTDKLDAFMEPMELRRVAGLIAAWSARLTGVDLGEEQLTPQMPLPDMASDQVHNSVAANNARLHAPPVTVQPTGTPTGGSSGLAGP